MFDEEPATPAPETETPAEEKKECGDCAPGAEAPAVG